MIGELVSFNGGRGKIRAMHVEIHPEVGPLYNGKAVPRWSFLIEVFDPPKFRGRLITLCQHDVAVEHVS